MLNKIIEGRYQTTSYEKSKYQKFTYRSIYVYKDNKGNIVKFEGNYFSEIENAVKDVVKYLKRNKIQGEYPLIFNSSALYLSAETNVEESVKEYLETYRDNIFTNYEFDI